MPEYAHAYVQFLAGAYAGFLEADPVLGKIEQVPTTGTLDHAYVAGDGSTMTTEGAVVRVEHAITWDAVIDGDLDDLTTSIGAGALQCVEQHLAYLVEYVQSLTQQTGNVVDAKGMATWDAILAAFDKVEWSPNEAGKVQPPDTVMLSPDVAAKLGDPPPDFEERLGEIASRKQAEFDAGRRSRRLP